MNEKKQRPETHQRWHITKTVNVTQIFAVGGIIVSLFVYISNFEKRVVLLESDAVGKERIAVIESDIKLVQQAIEYNQISIDKIAETTKEISVKVDRLAVPQ